MNLYEFLTHADVSLPQHWDNHDDFEAFIRERLQSYRSLIDQLESNAVADVVQGAKDRLEGCCGELCRSLRVFFEGHPHEAYKHFDAAIQPILPEIKELAFDGKELGILYRVRQTDAADLHRNSLFHIPFEKRHLVATQRYSIPGLPCLYMAGSLYTCWEEMGRPPLHELQCAAFWVKGGKSLKMLNFSNRPSRLAIHVLPPGSVPSDYPRLSSEIILWPLVFTSSIIVKHRSSPFKPEYIIPQMVLQWVTQNHGFDGLVYFSTHITAVSKTHPLAACNVVLPAKDVRPHGRCSWLCDTVKMTDPFGWQLLSSINVIEGAIGGTIPMYKLEFIDGFEEPYYKTEFGNVQTKLNVLVATTAHRNRNGEPAIGDVSSA